MINIKLHTVIRDLTGKTGMAIVEAIIKGERRAKSFLVHVDKNIRADRTTIVKSLQGNWRSEQLFILDDCYKNYQYYKEKITCCDSAIERQLQQYQIDVFPTAAVIKEAKSTKRATKNKPKFNTCSYLKAILGVECNRHLWNQ